ncbi:MAG: GNAT family N-acetyltransferase [Hyphomicrobiaceae bacterium]
MSEPMLSLPPGFGLEPVATISAAGAGDATIVPITEPLPPDLARALSSAVAGMDPWKRYGFDPAVVMRYCAPAEASAPRYLVTRREEILGLFAIKLGWMFGSYLNILAIMPASQGRGIGSAVLRWIEERARANGERNQFVVTSAFNTRGLALYRSHGYEQIATMPGLINDTESEILLRKRLAGTEIA